MLFDASPARFAPPASEFTADERRFLIENRAEIAAELRELARRAVRVTAHAPQVADYLLTNLIDVDGEAGEFSFEPAARDGLTHKILAAQRIVFETRVDGARMKFSASNVALVHRGGRARLVAALPAALMRKQQREYYRVAMPMARPVRCSIPYVRGREKGWHALPLFDLSCGGAALIATPRHFMPEPDMRYPCSIELPGVGVVQGTLELRSVTEWPGAAGEHRLKCGFEFIELAGGGLQRIQRYIMDMQLRGKGTLATRI